MPSASARRTPSTSALFQHGLLDEVRAAAMFWFTPEPPENKDEPVFAGIPLRAQLIDPTDPDLTAHTHGAGVISIGAFELLLAARASKAGAEQRYECPLTGFTEDADGVTVEAGGATVRTGWLVGFGDPAHR